MNIDGVIEWFFEHYADPAEYLPDDVSVNEADLVNNPFQQTNA